MILHFPIMDVMGLIKHAVNAEQHRYSGFEDDNELDPEPSLWLVGHGQGNVVLESNGLPDGAPKLPFTSITKISHSTALVDKFLEVIPIEKLVREFQDLRQSDQFAVELTDDGQINVLIISK